VDGGARSRLDAQRGQTLVLVALLLVVLLGIVSLSVDVGYYRYQQRLMQSAADSAALAGAAEISSGTADAAAIADATANGFADGVNNVHVTVNSNYSDQYTGSSPAVQVTITNSYPKFFGGVLGGASNVPVAVSAVARMSANVNMCLYQLDPGGNPNFNGMTFNGPQCGIITNGTPNFNGANIDAKYIGYQQGRAPNENGATFSEATPAPSLPATDPCPNIPGCNYLTNNPPSTSSCAYHPDYNGQTVTLVPGCYDTPNFNGANVTFQSGTYVFTGPPNFNGATLTGNGVTLYFPAGVCGNFNHVNLDLTPPTSGPTQGVLIYAQPGTNGCGPNFNGSTGSTISGLVYYPSYHVNFNGSFNSYVVLVVGDVNFNGSSQNFPDPPANGTLVQMPALAE
jgi:Flp pilus assembly protein TadG